MSGDIASFVPLSSQLGVSGTSYRIQLGKISEQWAARILKGNDVVMQSSFPELNGNLIVGFVMRETAIPNLNPYQIMKTVQFLTREAQTNEQRMKEKGGIPAPEPGKAIPADAPEPQPQFLGVPEEEKSEEDIRASYRVVAKPKEDAPVPAPVLAPAPVAGGKPVTIPSSRPLKAIPSAEGDTSTLAQRASAAASGNSSVAQRASAIASETKRDERPEPKAPVEKQAPVKAGASGNVEQRLAAIEETLARIEKTLKRIEEELFK
nr:hypothetical protein [Candidatus Sigynarchaeota archaeon]